MSLLRRQPEPTIRESAVSRETAADRHRRVTYVASGSRIVGVLSGDTDVLIEGVVEGEVQLQGTVTIGKTGQVEGSISAATIQLAGRVRGNLRGRDRVELAASASLDGDIASPRVVIAEGAFFTGRIQMQTGVTEDSGGGGAATEESQRESRNTQRG
jgi:cytoskeletal protein CcmA (bactofilin family)